MANDIELLESWQAGDADAGERLFERYYDSVYHFFRYKLDEDVVDLVQQTFTGLIEGVDRVHTAQSFRSYLFGIAHNLLRRHLRDRYRRDNKHLDLDLVSIEDLVTGASTAFVKEEQKRLLLLGLRRIPLEFQVLLELRYWEQLKTAEIAEALDIPHSTVRGRLRRAHLLLEESMIRLARSAPEWQQSFHDLQAWARACRAELDPDMPSSRE